MMINKRLIGTVSESKKYIAGNVILQWCSLVANITMMAGITCLLGGLFEGTAGEKEFVTIAIIAAAAVIVRFICTIMASRMGYLSSKTVKKTLREMIYKKLLKLGNSYREKVQTSEIVQVAVEGVDQLETYFGAYLPQFFYAMLAPFTLFVVLSFVNFLSAIVLLICVPLIPVAIAAVQTWAKKLLSKYWGQYTSLGDTFLENLQGLTTLKIYQADGFKHKEMNEESEKFRKITMKVLTMQLNSITIMDLIAYGGAALGVIMATTMCVFIGSFHILSGVLALVAYIVVGIIVPIITSKLSGENGAKVRNGSGELSGFVLDSIRGLTEILQYGQGEKRLKDMNKMTDKLLTDEERLKRVSGRNIAITNAVILLFDIIMLLSSAYLCSANLVGFDGVLIPTIALMSSFGPVVALANLGSTLQNTFAAGNRVLDILDEKPAVEEIHGNKEIEFSNAKVQGVTFSYDEEIILDDVTLDIEKGSVVGIIGKSGCGKSTFLKLLMRFWKVQKGNVQISDTDIENVNTGNLRDMESFMTQDTHLFHDSIKNNVKIAKTDATDDEIIEACRKASVHEFIMSLPLGYDTEIGELGDTLSGGERQRIGLARAFLHNAAFMLLDEPTSNLDSINESVILKSLKEERKNKTVVLVSHRQSTMRIADNVYFIENLSKTGSRLS